jgi:hypothetical protein
LFDPASNRIIAWLNERLVMLLRNIVLITLMSAVLVLAQDHGGGPTRAQLGSKDQTKLFSESFLTKLGTARPFDAFKMLRDMAPESEGEIDASRQSTEALLDQVRPSYGRMLDFELLDTKSLGKSFVRYDYLLKFERNAIHCRFVFYQPRNTWLPVSFTVNQDLTQLFEDLGK